MRDIILLACQDVRGRIIQLLRIRKRKRVSLLLKFIVNSAISITPHKETKA
jgi:hypothetical protein